MGALAQIRRVEQHQQTPGELAQSRRPEPVRYLRVGSFSATLAVTSDSALFESDGGLAQVFRLGLSELRPSLTLLGADGPAAGKMRTFEYKLFQHRAAPVYSLEHRHPLNDLRGPTIGGGPLHSPSDTCLRSWPASHQTHDYYMTIGPQFAGPVACRL